jgi:phosphoribosyl 1,2-cyclic phosphodiesterase
MADMTLTFWGVRGSLPTPGKQTIRYGGNTPCIEVRLSDGNLLILDAGTGIRNLGDNLVKRGERLNSYLFITHPHWDHIQGFPFFGPVFMPGNTLTIIGTERPDKKLAAIIAEQMNRIFFPVELHDLKAKIDFCAVGGDERFEVFRVKVSTIFVNHPGFTVGYRFEYNSKVLVYISDNEPFDPRQAPAFANVERSVIERFQRNTSTPNKHVFDFCRDADVLIHDATYTPEEYKGRIGWGHSDYLFTLKVAQEANVKRLFLFHHDHMHSDGMVDDIVDACRKEAKKQKLKIAIDAAMEGKTVTI